jgi:hypothetical protein
MLCTITGLGKGGFGKEDQCEAWSGHFDLASVGGCIACDSHQLFHALQTSVRFEIAAKRLLEAKVRDS